MLVKEKKFSNVRLFNGYRSVTRRLYEDWVKPRDKSTCGHVYVIMGFGQFGRMLYSHFITDNERSSEDDIFIGELVQTYADDSVLTDGKIDVTGLKPLLFDMASKKYWALGPSVGNCWNAGKALNLGFLL